MEAGGGYPDSVDSSPRSRGGESWDEPFPAPQAAKLRLMCSYGGHIVPRPHDKSLCYLGGETRLIVVDRHTTLADLSARFSRSLLNGRPFTIKYQLPSEDLDSLISVTTDEDLDNMVDEYDRVASGGNKPPRIRLFLFPAKAESAPPSIGSLLDDSKSETWFVDALNGAIVMGGGVLPRGLSADSAGSSVNCLLGLEDEPNGAAAAASVSAVAAPPPPLPPTPTDPDPPPRADSPGKPKIDPPSVPDSPMLDTTSSFGSASSNPILSNLPPIRVRPDEPRVAVGIEEHFAQMNMLAQKPEDFAPIQPQPPPPVSSFVTASSTPVISPTGNPPQVNRSFSDDEKPPPPPPKPTAFDAAAIPQRVYLPDGSPSADARPEAGANLVPEPNYRAQMTPPPEPSYLISHPQHHQQQQYVQANPQLVQHQPGPTPVLPYQSFYQMQPALHSQQQLAPPHGYGQQIPMFFLPVQANPNYGLPVPQPGLDGKPVLPIPSSVLQSPSTMASASKPELVAGSNMYRAGSPGIAPQQLVQLGNQPHQQFMGYHPMQHPSQSVAAAGYRYEYPNPVQAQQLYYAQPTSAPLPSHYQTVVGSSPTPVVMTEAVPPPIDAKQTRAAS